MGSKSPVRITPSIRRYEWGDKSFIPHFFGLSEDGAPWAEAWYGAHPAAPARAHVDGTVRVLSQLIDDDKVGILGTAVARRYGELPYLLKVLACAKPLSIQVHPSLSQAAAGFMREEAAGIPRDSDSRSYRDSNHKPEVLVAWTPYYALVGFRSGEGLAAALRDIPELSEILPTERLDAAGLRALVEAYFALPDETVAPRLSLLMRRLETAQKRRAFSPEEPQYWALKAHREFSKDGHPDRGLLFIFLLQLMILEPGEAVFLPPGIPHAYLQGAGLELMSASDNVLRAGLTPKHIDVAELMRIVRFDAAPLNKLLPIPVSDRESAYPFPIPELSLRRISLDASDKMERCAAGPETVIAGPGQSVTILHGGTSLRLAHGEAALVPADTAYRLEAEAPVNVYIASTPEPPCDTPRTDTGDSSEDVYAAAIERNIAVAEALFERGEPAHIVGTVCGSSGAQKFWQRRLDAACAGLCARKAISFHEDLPVNQAFGLLLLWQRLRPVLNPGEGALIAFVFGDGTRAAPFTETECGQKPAIASFVMDRTDSQRPLSIVESALRTFAPVEAYLRRSGFSGIVVKWGDEVQIPTLDLSGSDPRFADADIVRFVSMRAMTDDDARHKDWVGVTPDGRVIAFIPRRSLAEMERLADRGLLQRRDGELFGGINLGSIALSRKLLDALLEEFSAEVNDETADRAHRPDLDPQIFTALTIAAIDDPAERASVWEATRAESPAVEKLATMMPKVIERLRGAMDRFKAAHGRPINIAALDFCDQYWGDIGQHRRMYDLYMALADEGAAGRIARALAGIDTPRDAAGNILFGTTRLGPDVQARGSVFINAEVTAGCIENSVLIGTRAHTVTAERAFDLMSIARSLSLAPRSGSYKVVSDESVSAAFGERVTTVFLPDESFLMRVTEDTDLKDRKRTYDVPILGNAISFDEAHKRVTKADPGQLEARRSAAGRNVEAFLHADLANSFRTK